MQSKQAKSGGSDQRIADAVAVARGLEQLAGRRSWKPRAGRLHLFQRPLKRLVEMSDEIIESTRIEAAELRSVHDVGNAGRYAALFAAVPGISHLRQRKD